MKKHYVFLAAALMAASLMACGQESTEPQTTTEQVEATESTQQEVAEETTEQADDSELGVPEVKDGVLQAGEDGAESYFEWSPVEGADGYEVSVLSKYYADTEFADPEEVYETKDTSYTVGAQDYFDFLIKVRAYKGEGSDRVYGDWSGEAAGFTYEDSDIAEE